MIDFYNKRCVELLDVIVSNGYCVEEIDGVLTSSNDLAVQSIIDNFTLQELKDRRCAYVDKLATDKRNKVIAPYSPGEMAAWPIKRVEALAYQSSGNPSDAPNLSAEAASRGMSLQTLVTKVLNDAARFSWIEAHIAGTSGRHRDAIRLCQTHEEIMNYNYNTGWPV